MLAKRAAAWLDLFMIAAHKSHKSSFHPALEAEQRPRMGRGGGHCLPRALFLKSLQFCLRGSIRFSQLFPLEGVPAAHIVGRASPRSCMQQGEASQRSAGAGGGSEPAQGCEQPARGASGSMRSASSGGCQASPKGNLDIILMDFLWLLSISYGVFFLQPL